MKRAFTLIEVLLVVFILAAVAASAVSVLDTADAQLRYDDSRNRLTRLREGILGDETPQGRRTPFGFVADVGRLPESVDELLTQPAGLPAWDDVDDDAGWRGPYVALPPQQPSATPTYLDGWGQDWTLTHTPALPVTPATTLTVASPGQGDTAGPSFALTTEDAFVDASLVVVRVVFDDPDMSVHAQRANLRARLHHPLNGADVFIQSVGASTDDPIAALPNHSGVVFTFPSTLPTTWIPWGLREVEVVLDDGSAFGSGTRGRVLLTPRSTPPTFDMNWSTTP